MILLSADKSMALEPDQVFEKASPSIVVINGIDAAGRQVAQGSGVVVAHEQVITNCHVLKKARTILAKSGTTKYMAKLLLPDVERDLCLLEVKGLTAPVAPASSMQAIKIGQKVYSIGAPRGLELSLTDGLVSSIRELKNNRLIQTSTPISPGSSGGGLFDDQARLVGITTMSLRDSQNLNFAIPVDYLKELPERGKANIEKMQAILSANKAARTQNLSTSRNNRNHKKLDLAEMKTHFLSHPHIRIHLIPTQQDFYLNVAESYVIINMAEKGSETRRGGVNWDRQQNAVCFYLNLAAADKKWFKLHDCFELYQNTPNSYVMKAHGKEVISYNFKE